MSIDEIKNIIAAGGDTRPQFDRIKQLIQQDGGNNLVDQTGGSNHRTLLWSSAQFGDLKLAQFLIQHGADVNHAEPRSNGWTPLHVAAKNNHLDVVKCLIEAGGAQVDKGDKYKRSPLCWASESGHVAIIRYLIEQSGNTSINQVDNCGRTPFWWACWNGHLEVVKYLLDMGANHLIQDIDGETAFGVAQQYGHTTVANLLNEHNQEKMKAGEKKRNEIQKLCFDCQKIQSKDEVEIVIEYLEKRLKSLPYLDKGVNNDVEQMNQWFVNNKGKRDLFVEIYKDGEKMKSLDEMEEHIGQLKTSLDVHTKDYMTENSLKMFHVDHDALKESYTDYQSHSLMIEKEMDEMYCSLAKARLGHEQRLLAMGQI